MTSMTSVVVDGRVFARSWHTPGSLKYVRGFRTDRRRETTIEFVPR